MLLLYLMKWKNITNYVEKNKNLILSLTHMKMLLNQEIITLSQCLLKMVPYTGPHNSLKSYAPLDGHWPVIPVSQRFFSCYLSRSFSSFPVVNMTTWTYCCCCCWCLWLQCYCGGFSFSWCIRAQVTETCSHHVLCTDTGVSLPSDSAMPAAVAASSIDNTSYQLMEPLSMYNAGMHIFCTCEVKCGRFVFTRFEQFPVHVLGCPVSHRNTFCILWHGI